MPLLRSLARVDRQMLLQAGSRGRIIAPLTIFSKSSYRHPVCFPQRSFSYFSKTVAVKRESDGGMTKTTTDLLKRLKGIDTAILCDADKTIRAHQHDSSISSHYTGLGLMAGGIKARNAEGGKHAVGLARTVQLSRPNDFLAVLRGLDEAKAAEILVVNTLDSTRAVAGGLFLTEAQRKNLGAIIIDGPVRDISTVSQCSVLCYSTAITPYAGTVQSPGEMQVNVACGGVRVSPGDIVVADGDGVVVGSKQTFLQLIDHAENIQIAEDALMTGMRQGISLHSMSNFKDHLELRMKGKESTLDFRKKRLVTFEGIDTPHFEKV